METPIYKYSYVQNHIKYFSSFNVWFKGNYWQLAGRDLVTWQPLQLTHECEKGHSPRAAVLTVLALDQTPSIRLQGPRRVGGCCRPTSLFSVLFILIRTVDRAPQETPGTGFRPLLANHLMCTPHSLRKETWVSLWRWENSLIPSVTPGLVHLLI